VGCGLKRNSSAFSACIYISTECTVIPAGCILQQHDLITINRGSIREFRNISTTTKSYRSVWGFAYSLVELSSVQHEAVVSLSEDSTLGSDAASCVHVVSRHHPYRYTGPLTLADCVRHLQSVHKITNTRTRCKCPRRYMTLIDVMRYRVRRFIECNS